MDGHPDTIIIDTHSYQVERAIEIALANPVDFEYAIDKEASFISVF